MADSNNNSFLIPAAILVGAIIIAGAVIYAVNPSALKVSSSSQTSSETKKVDIQVTSQDHIRGSASAPITIVEFSDLQCPFCQRFHPELQQALAEYGNKVRWVYKHFPLESIHAQAEAAAEASECVWEQKGNDGFWNFADQVFLNQDRIGPALFKEVAQNIGVNMAQFNSCVSSSKYKDKVQADLQEGLKLGVQGTPTSFVNGTALEGALPYAQLKSAIEEALKQSK